MNSNRQQATAGSTTPSSVRARSGVTIGAGIIDATRTWSALATSALTQRAAVVSDKTEASGPSVKWLAARLMLVVALSSLPILAISAHVFGLMSERTTAVLVILPLAGATAAVFAFAPHRTDGIIGRGLVVGMVACGVYDAFRLFAVYALGLMGDFIPTMGTWVTGNPDIHDGAVVGYIWRYIGDGGGLGVAFFVVAFVVGLDRWSNRPHRVVLAAVGYAVFPVWAGLIGTVALAPHGEELMFRLTPNTVTITLIGHVIFGLVLGLGFLRAAERFQLPASAAEHRSEMLAVAQPA